MFKLRELPIKGAFVIESSIHLDERGTFQKKLHRGFFEKHGLTWNFSEQYFTTSKKDVIRGLHFQKPPFDHVKLIYCISGEAVDVLLDLRKHSPTYGKCTDIHLQADDGQSVYVPKGIAHGFRSLAENTTMMYSVSTCHEAQADEGILWNSVSYDWKINNPIVSPRDRSFPPLSKVTSPFPEL